MDYKVLYRKYRPTDFSSIIGQDYIVSILKNAIKQDKISHAYIFSGPRGTGKTSTAKVFAKAINCLNPTTEGPCNECDNCRNFSVNSDIIEIDAASNNGVDEIREIINNIKLAPSSSKYKVYIIDEVHMLSTSAFNALLLTLEEPPKHVVFILATTNIEAVPITILSRCQRFDFHKVSMENIKKRLEYVIEAENIAIEPEAITEIADISDGGMRDALSILDQLSHQESKVTLSLVVSHFGSVSIKQIEKLFQSILNNDIKSFTNLMHNFKDLAVDYKLLIKKILEYIETQAINSKKNADYAGLSYNDLKTMAFELASISNYVNLNIDAYTLIEITLLKYFKGVTPALKEEIKIPEEKGEVKSPEIPKIEETAPISTVEPKEVEEKSNEPNVPEDFDLTNLKKIRINNCFVNASKESLQKLKDIWPEFISALPDKILLNLLIDSQIVAASDKNAIITNDIDTTVNLINKNIYTLDTLFQKHANLSYHFIALTNTEWQESRNIYISNKKNNILYEYQEEPPLTIKENSSELSAFEKTAYDIFSKDKIEVE